MEDINVRIIAKACELPELHSTDFFHSPELFRIMENTSGHSPYMLIAEDGEGNVLGHVLATVRRRGSLIPPYFFTQVRVYGEGEYREDVNRQEVFGVILRKLTAYFSRKLCLYIEFSDMGEKMFGYKHFRRNDFFPVSWLEIHNSLHSLPPEERLLDKARHHIERAYNHGVITREAKSDGEIESFYNILRHQRYSRMRRFIPPKEQIENIAHSECGQVFVTLYKGKIIGGSVCVYSEGNAYLWYMATRSKSYHMLHPDTVTVWHAIKYAYANNYAHIRFLDCGLPFFSNSYRDFVLSFGGKPVSKYRWFRFTLPWVNNVLFRFFRN
ncbi:MAG: GNAT family N-acetyltransferase [Prevotella sp.]|nr:GNAT family N-acetyltransferase [Prevotella sp.]